MESEELQKIYAVGEQAPYYPYAETSLAYRGIASILYQKLNPKDINPEFECFQDKFSSFEEFWCAVEWDLTYRAMCGSGLINVSDDVIKPQGKRRWADKASNFFVYLDNPSKVPFSDNHKGPNFIKLSTVSEALYIYAIYYAQRNNQFLRQEFSVFVATIKRCHREVRNNKLQIGYLLADQSLVIGEKHRKKVLKPISEK